jgi:hypothetical protein
METPIASVIDLYSEDFYSQRRLEQLLSVSASVAVFGCLCLYPGRGGGRGQFPL